MGLRNVEEGTVDEDLGTKSHDELLAEVLRLRAAIREHRDSTGHDLCWHHPKLWDLLPAVRYRQSVDEQRPDAPRTREEAP
jgi:hypothetical protein